MFSGSFADSAFFTRGGASLVTRHTKHISECLFFLFFKFLLIWSFRAHHFKYNKKNQYRNLTDALTLIGPHLQLTDPSHIMGCQTMLE
ncbi:hypothetical protein PAHAL_5G506300 [Panicum hallii]|jgi:hypothetical protein|uniref:Uncharacterized protein n=1 Tax=Panicum hallii TaxID=206008 RepID=A0A2S3HYK8_9POAL|nr:hypothetical protein PAHAL_5G506300 [Panicum hallii]